MAQGGQRWLQALQWVLGQAEDTKDLRSTLDTVDPAGKDAHKQMSKGELQGKITGLHMQEQAKSQALSDALKSAQLSGFKDQASSESAMSSAMRQAMPAMTSTTSDLNGQPAAAGNPFTVNVNSTRPMQPGDLMKAIAANPQAINSPAGRQAMNDWMRNATTTQRGAPQFMKGPDGGTWAYNQFTGQFEPSPVDKINATAKAKAEAKGPANPEGPIISRDGKFYSDDGGHTWKQRQAGKTNLFGEGDEGGGGGGGGISYTRDKSGNLIRGGE